MRNLCLIYIFLCCVSSFSSNARAADHQLRVLILTGKNNHDWQHTTPVLTQILEESGRFHVRILEDPALCDSLALRNCDVIISNWTNFPAKDRDWGRTAENAIAEFVRSGKGFVLFHAAGASFPSWPDFQQLIGATWGDSTGHGPYRAFNVSVVDTGHPITRVIGGFTTEDELWHRMTRKPEAHVLCTAYSDTAGGGSGRWEPVAFSNTFGHGRAFYLVLGHDVRAMLNANWRLLLLRGTEWAATGEASIDLPYDIARALQRASSIAAPNREQLGTVEQLVQSSSRNPVLQRKLASTMAEMLAGNASAAWKKFFCQQLSLIGTAGDVPLLARLLNDTTLGFYARYTLERIPADQSVDALRSMTATSGGLTLVGLLNALGEKKDAQAVELLGQYSAGDHVTAVKAAAIHALGKIGGPEAVRILKHLPADSALHLLVAGSLLRSAEEIESTGDLPHAAAIYESLNNTREPSHIHAAAFAGILRCRKDQSSAMIARALESGNDTLFSAVLRVLRESGGKALAAAVAARTAMLPPPIRARAFYALADVRERGALPDMYAALSHRNRSLQTAAIHGIGKIGDSSSVERLCAALYKADARQRGEIKKSLIRLQGPGVDERLLAMLTARSTPTTQAKVIPVLAARNTRNAIPTLLSAARTGGPAVRKAAIEALGLLADGTISADLVQRLNVDRFAAERPFLVRTLIKIGLRDPTPDRVCENILAQLPSSRPRGKESMFQVLGGLGGQKAVQAVQSALRDPNQDISMSAIRVLSSWPDSSPLKDLLALAHGAGNASARTLALRGGISLLEKSPDLTEEARVAMIEQEIRHAHSSKANIMLMSALGRQSSPQALRVAVSCLEQPGIEDEAALTVLKIVRAIAKGHAVEGQQALERALQAVKSDSIAQQLRSESSRLEFRTRQGKIKAAVVTGGHEFDKAAFLELFTSDEVVTYTHLPQTDDSEVFEDISDWPYDVIILYNFTQKISEKRRGNFLRLLDDGVGVLSLHHASGAFQEWCEFPKIIGCRYFLSPVERNGVRREPSTYLHDVDIPVHIADTTHAVTRGLGDFEIHDETYHGCDFEPDNHLLLSTTQQSSDQPLGWARAYRRSRIVHFQLGHGPESFANEQYRRLVWQAVRWCAQGRWEQGQPDTNNRGNR